MIIVIRISSINSSKGQSAQGFLLIEMIAALAILGVFLFSITHSLSRTIQWQQEAMLQLRALDASTSMLESVVEQQRLPSLLQRTINGCTVTVAPFKLIVQSNDFEYVSQKLIVDTGRADKHFKAISITSAWDSPSGKKRELQILTGIMV